MPLLKPKALNIEIVTGDSRPIFKQIVDGVRREMAKGRIVPGDLLPSYRGLAAQLTINPNTVAKAYSQLANDGIVDSRKGLGLFVAEPRQVLSKKEKQQRLAHAVDGFINDTISLGFSDDQILSEVERALTDLSTQSAKRAS